MKESYLLTICSDDRKGLISIITSVLNRKLIEIESICTCRSIGDLPIVIHMEIKCKEMEIKSVVRKIQNIVEVFKVEHCLLKEAHYQRTALFTIEDKLYSSSLETRLQKYKGSIIHVQKNEFIIQAMGSEELLDNLLEELKGPHLKHFYKSGAINLKPIAEGQSSVISKAA